MSDQAAMHILEQLARMGVKADSLCADSRALVAGDVFLAMPGARADGRSFIAEAIARKPAAVLWERRGYYWRAEHAVANLPVEHLRELSGYLAHIVYGRPSEAMWMVGVTGTNGKTSVSQWIARAFAALERKCGVIGTLGAGFPDRLSESLNTTPDALTLHQMLRRFRAEGAQAVAMEVSSIGLDQGRVNGVHFDIAVFTNLTRDHLEYHGSMGAYAEAKKKLFAWPRLKSAVLNVDDPVGREIFEHLRDSGVRRIGYSLASHHLGLQAGDMLLAVRGLNLTGAGLRFSVSTPVGEAAIAVPMVGEFNAANLLAVLGTLLASNIPLERAAWAINRLTPPPGRLQTAGGTGTPLAVIDYAHTPDALEKALAALRPTAKARGGRLICVFGCGGERDPGKRPLMGEVAVDHADKVIITSDNPRGEDPERILDDVARGTGARAARIVDRAEAIRRAIQEADARDVVLIAGKGHEAYQEIAGRRLPFSDLEQAAAALAARGGARP
ncbi:MAG: UDP-N-acetylmuramoyl-L-alanyl-D-glutamate--2,6-diaminopimelate ligase [Pseudomonadota bacterium]